MSWLYFFFPFWKQSIKCCSVLVYVPLLGRDVFYEENYLSGTCVWVKCGGEGTSWPPNPLLPKDVIETGLARQGRIRKAAPCVVQLEGLWQCKDCSDSQRTCWLERKKGLSPRGLQRKKGSHLPVSVQGICFLLESSQREEEQHGGGHGYSAENISSTRGWDLK